MGKVRRKCHFTPELKNEFPFLKETDIPEIMLCLKCKATISIQNSGRSQIEKHLNSKKHKESLNAASGSKSVTTYFNQKQFGQSDKSLAASEGLFAYHTVFHNQSFKSLVCTAGIVRRIFQPKFSCSRTKATAIVLNVFYPNELKQLKSDLNNAKFISIYHDGSNHKDIKLMPLIVRYFCPDAGIQLKLLQLQSIPGETAELINEYIVSAVRKHDIQDKLIAVCADNANTNFGGKKRNGKNNVYYKLQESLKREIVGIGCTAHIVHNAIKAACDCLPVDVETIVVKIYTHFYIYTVRVESLKEFCEFCEVNYQQVLGYSKTRFLALFPAVNRLLQMFAPLKSYFLSIDECPTVIKNFFENPEAEFWLYFVHNISAIFQTTILNVEGQNVTVLGVSKAMHDLQEQIQNRLDGENPFLPLLVRNKLIELRDEGLCSEKKVKSQITKFYQSSLQYLQEWTSPFKEYHKYFWVDLNTVLPEWQVLDKDLPDLLTIFQKLGHTINDGFLLDEWKRAQRFITATKVEEWKERKLDAGSKWAEVFSHFSKAEITSLTLETLVGYFLTLPGTNAITERVFAIINKMWTTEKTNLEIPTLEAMLFVKVNTNLKCNEFYEYLLKSENMLKAIHSSAKYE